MALENENGSMVMPVTPMYGGGYGMNNGGFGFGGDGFWILILFFLLAGNGWGNGFGGGFCGNMAADSAVMYPWMNQSNQIHDGFRDQMINDNVTSIRDGVYGITNQLCAGFAGVNATVNGAQNAIAQQLYTNQIADMERSFNAQTASTAGMSAIQSQLAQCCCDNKSAALENRYVLATEACATRTASAQNTHDIIDNQNRVGQSILDKLCALELDGYKRENDNLRQQLNMSQLAASQTAQNALIQQGFSNEVDALYNRLNSCPVPSTPVYGRTPIFTCGNQGCGCGCGVA